MKRVRQSNWKRHLVWVLPVVIILIILLSLVGTYNGLVQADVNVDTNWAQVEAVYQRRADLIPNLVETVKGVAEQETELFTSVTEARTQWLNAQSPEQQVAAANEMESALARLLVTVEAYPEMKSNQNFLALQDQLEGAENRITVERKRYNDAVGAYNKRIRVFPTNLIAAMFGFEKREFFEAQAGAENAPQVEF